MSMVQEFKEFALRGNMVDLAVGIVIGGAFSGLVQSLVTDVMMPPLGLLIGGVDFSDVAFTLRAAAGESPAVTLNIGKFVSSLISFTIMAFAVFLVVKAMNRISGKPAAPKAASPRYGSTGATPGPSGPSTTPPPAPTSNATSPNTPPGSGPTSRRTSPTG
jgi:large conductance mechanosensitive channel